MSWWPDNEDGGDVKEEGDRGASREWCRDGADDVGNEDDDGIAEEDEDESGAGTDHGEGGGGRKRW